MCTVFCFVIFQQILTYSSCWYQTLYFASNILKDQISSPLLKGNSWWRHLSFIENDMKVQIWEKEFVSIYDFLSIISFYYFFLLFIDILTDEEYQRVDFNKNRVYFNEIGKQPDQCSTWELHNSKLKMTVKFNRSNVGKAYCRIYLGDSMLTKVIF